ncbi:MAG: N-(5-phosphoribosyl)anthranilate isomerase [Bacilli bacterium]|nr:N-(5-phosphoribosyl)anthranilate isomerase [Bacilli bacterium]
MNGSAAQLGIKICGLQTREEVVAAVGEGATHIGFMFASSRRQVSSTVAAALAVDAEGVDKVGVFVDPTLEELQRVVEQVPLTVIQLHGNETPEFCTLVREAFAAAGIKVWKAVSVQDDFHLEELLPYAKVVDSVLVDAYHPDQRGGSGQTFGWEILPEIQRLFDKHQLATELWVAGGLDPENVGELVRGYSLHGVDVSSGVEIERSKSPERIRDFINEVKRSHALSR